MGYFERLDEKLNASENDLNKQNKKILKLAELQRKAKYGDEYNSLYDNYLDKRDIHLSIIRDLEEQQLKLSIKKNKLYTKKRKVSEVKRMVTDLQREYTSFIQKAKKHITQKYDEIKSSMVGIEDELKLWCDAVNYSRNIECIERVNDGKTYIQRKKDEYKIIGPWYAPEAWMYYMKKRINIGSKILCSSAIIECLEAYQKYKADEYKRFEIRFDDLEYDFGNSITSCQKLIDKL